MEMSNTSTTLTGKLVALANILRGISKVSIHLGGLWLLIVVTSRIQTKNVLLYRTTQVL